MTKPLVLAHRGYSGKYPENSLLAFEMAIQTGCHGFESDVHLSADGEPVIIHDATLDRTTSGSGLVADHTFRQLQKLDCGFWKGPEFVGQHPLHLEELLQLVMDHHLLLNLELKNYEVFYEGLEEKVIRCIAKYKAQNQVFLSSFNHPSMVLCKGICPEIQTGFLYGYPLLDMEQYAARYPVDALHPRYQCLQYDRELVRKIHAVGRKVNTWTVNTLPDMDFCIQAGADAIITNYPQTLMDRLQEEEK